MFRTQNFKFWFWVISCYLALHKELSGCFLFSFFYFLFFIFFLNLLWQHHWYFSKKNIEHIMIINMVFNFRCSRYFLYKIVILVLTLLVSTAITKQAFSVVSIIKTMLYNKIKWFYNGFFDFVHWMRNCCKI